mmetsp:Transcript_23462/g.45582  ORF Transcript_23462/g.45582 Transcript_23462/m.45582 type:complete len:226 (+) Transcript_23462:60-737(+)
MPLSPSRLAKLQPAPEPQGLRSRLCSVDPDWLEGDEEEELRKRLATHLTRVFSDPAEGGADGEARREDGMLTPVCGRRLLRRPGYRGGSRTPGTPGTPGTPVALGEDGCLPECNDGLLLAQGALRRAHRLTSLTWSSGADTPTTGSRTPVGSPMPKAESSLEIRPFDGSTKELHSLVRRISISEINSTEDLFPGDIYDAPSGLCAEGPSETTEAVSSRRGTPLFL